VIWFLFSFHLSACRLSISLQHPMRATSFLFMTSYGVCTWKETVTVRITNSSTVQWISLYSQWSNCSAIFFFAQHAIECTGDDQHSGGLLSEWIVHEFTNASLAIPGYYFEEDNSSRIIRALRIDFIITNDIQKLQCFCLSKVSVNGSMKPSIL